jgi:hypothetical protein
VLQIEDYESDFNRYYHGAGDTVAHMDHQYWLAQMRAAVAAIAHLAIPYVDEPPASPTSEPSPSPTQPPSATATATVVASLPPATATLSPTRTASHTATSTTVASSSATPEASATKATEPPTAYGVVYLPLLLRSGG